MPYRLHRNANGAPRTSRVPPRPRRRWARWVEGVLVELDVERARLALRLHDDEELVVDIADASIRATDGDGDGRQGARDLFPGDRLRVRVAAGRVGERVVARRVDQLSAGAPTGGLRRLWASDG